MKRFKKLYYFIFPLVCIMALNTSCGHKSTAVTKRLTLNLQEGDPPSLNPYMGVDLRSRCLFLALFEPLMRRTSAGSLEPAAAERVEVDGTQTQYTFYLRPHYWSNGERVTASHFKAAWSYALQPGSRAIRADLFYAILNAEKIKKGLAPIESLGVTTPDATTLVVTLAHPTPYFLDLTATSFFAPLYEASPEEPSCFNGPFIVKEHLPEHKLVFSKNPSYWDKDNVEVQEICLCMIKDPLTALALYEKQQLDVVGDPLSALPLDVLPSLHGNPDLHTKLISRIFYLLLNTETFPLNNASIRKALSFSIDRKELTEHLFFGQRASLAPIPQTLSSWTEEELAEKAEEPLAAFERGLKELGLTRQTFPTITLAYADLSGQKKFAEFVQQEWKKKLGLEIKILCSEWNVHSAHLRKGNYEIGTLHLTTLYQDPLFYFDLFREKKAHSNYCRWENEVFQKFLNKIELASQSEERMLYLKAAENLLFEEMPAIGLFTQNLHYLTQKNIHLEISDLGIYDFKSARVDKES